MSGAVCVGRNSGSCFPSSRQIYLLLVRMRCKTALALCVFIVAVHMTLVLVLQGNVLSDLTAEMKVKFFQSSASSARAKRSANSAADSFTESLLGFISSHSR